MSLYNMLFGTSPAAPLLMAALGLKTSDVYRFRDCYLDAQGRIAVYTRGGGGNRECYCEADDAAHEDGCVVPIQERMQQHPCYLFDEDDDFDCTYATFYFKVPETLDREALVGVRPELARDDVWQQFIAALKASEEGGTE